MKIFITSDIEGTNGIAAWDETEGDKREYPRFALKMAEEVAAVCNGINDFNKDSKILVKDAHNSARNLDHKLLPENVTLNRGWGSSPLSMMFGIDKTFDASMMTGYHSAASFDGNPLAHTMSGMVTYLKINDLITSEFLMNYYTSLYFGVPVVMVTGDKMLCDFVKTIDEKIVTVPTLVGVGGSVTSPHPNVTLRALQQGANDALNNIGKTKMELPKVFKTEVRYRLHTVAKQASYYPGAKQISDHVVAFETSDYLEFLTYFMFTRG